MTQVLEAPAESPARRWTQAAANAREIWSGGACNPRAVARELVKAVDAACEVSGSSLPSENGAAEWAPARVILAHLCYLLKCAPDGMGGIKGTEMADELYLLRQFAEEVSGK